MYDTIQTMTKIKFPLMIMAVILAGCQADHYNNTEYVEYADYMDNVEYVPVAYRETAAQTAPCDDATSVVRYSVSPSGDLILETRHHVIQVDGAPGKQYAYYVWAGDKNYTDTPDLTVDANTITTNTSMPTQLATE